MEPELHDVGALFVEMGGLPGVAQVVEGSLGDFENPAKVFIDEPSLCRTHAGVAAAVKRTDQPTVGAPGCGTAGWSPLGLSLFGRASAFGGGLGRYAGRGGFADDLCFGRFFRLCFFRLMRPLFRGDLHHDHFPACIDVISNLRLVGVSDQRVFARFAFGGLFPGFFGGLCFLGSGSGPRFR